MQSRSVVQAEIHAAHVAAADTLVAGGSEEQALRAAKCAGSTIRKAFVEGEKPVEFKRGVRRGSTG